MGGRYYKKRKEKKKIKKISCALLPRPLGDLNPIVLHLQPNTLQLRGAFMIKYDCTAGALPLCLAKYRPRTMSAHRMANMTTATTPPMRAWSIFCGAPSPALESEKKKRGGGDEWSYEIGTFLLTSTYLYGLTGNFGR